MSRINDTGKYPFDTKVTTEDFLIGSDAEISPDGKYLTTKNYKIGDIISLVPTENTDSFNYGYRYTNALDVNTNPAYFTITGVDEQIENITSLTFNKTNSEGNDISDFFTSITGNEDKILFNITDGTENNFGFFRPVAVTNPTADTFNVTVTKVGTLQKGSLTNGQIYTSTFSVASIPAAGTTDYVSNVSLIGTNLTFTGVGSAFAGSVPLSTLDNDNYVSNVNFNTGTNELEFTGVGSGFNGNIDITSTLSAWDNVNGTPANQSSTDINYNGGNVGIGLTVSTSPDAKLHIKGSAAGSNLALKIEHSGTLSSLKANSLGSVWNTGSTGDNNNTIFGLGSSNGVLTTGSFNTLYGNGTGANITTGFANTLNGYTAGNNITTGNNNTFNGNASGFNNTNGSNNTFTGNGSGSNNVGGSSNCFYGDTSGNQNTEGQFNSFYGNDSGSANTDGESNSAFGSQSLKFNLSGSENVSIGDRSAYVDNLSVAVTNVSQSVFLGGETKPLSNGGTNEVVIGYNAIGNGSNTVTIGNSSIVRSYSKGVHNVSNAYTVATLPTGVRGDVAYVTDANFISYRSVAAGGSTGVALVFFDGTNWLYH